jgi:hypothetical protein
MKTRTEASRAELRRIFRVPLVLALLTAGGLLLGLLGDGLADGVAWLGLGVPIAVGCWYAVWGRLPEPARSVADEER